MTFAEIYHYRRDHGLCPRCGNKPEQFKLCNRCLAMERERSVKRKLNVEGKFCKCSRPAVKRKDHDWVCAVCDAIEERLYAGGDQVCGRRASLRHLGEAA